VRDFDQRNRQPMYLDEGTGSLFEHDFEVGDLRLIDTMGSMGRDRAVLPFRSYEIGRAAAPLFFG
jgi:hypothetical protein